MMESKPYPILEYDSQAEALIEPGKLIQPMDVPEHCVICFFQEVINDLVKAGRAKEIAQSKSEMGNHPLYEMEMEGRRVALFQPGIGAPLAAGLLEEHIARGCRKFIVCGGAGVLNKEIAVGHLIIPIAAVRDEGVSYHYLPPAREVHASPEAVAAIERVMERHHVPYTIGKTWTTDAIYRETPEKIRVRRDEGCLTVEMEAAAFFAVARFRQVLLGQILYSGDDVSGDEWDSRGWGTHNSVREKLVWLAAEACLEL
ncbi:MAG: nucleoside phosphorylase [Anaerolineae bacterium]|nr:nucleoside phosphorylase [Anaerolineae bacterium]